MAVQATLHEMRYKKSKTYVNERSVAENERLSKDESTMMLIKQMGNDIHPSIQLEVDYPSKHQDGKRVAHYLSERVNLFVLKTIDNR